MSGFVREENIRIRVQAISDLDSLEKQMSELIALTKQQQEITQQAALSARTSAIRQEEAIQGVTQALKDQQNQVKKTNDEASDSLKKVNNGYDDLGKTVRSVATLMAGAFTLGEIKSFGLDIIDAKTKIDQLKISLDVMLGSKKESAALYEQMVALAKNTPLSLEEVTQNVVKLKAYNLATEELIPTVTALGNIAAAVGKEKLPQITLAYGQIMNTGRLLGTETRQMVEAGVDLYGALSTSMGITRQEVIRLASDHKIMAEDVKKAILESSEVGGRFYNLMALQAKTVGGEVDKLKDSYQQAKVRIGDFFENTIKSGTSRLNDLMEATLSSNTAIARTVDIVKSVAAGFSTLLVITKGQEVATKALAVAEGIKNGVMAAGNLVAGTYNLTMIAATGTTDGFTAAQVRSAVAARSTWAAFAANPLGPILITIGLLTTAYYAWQAASDEVTTTLGEQELKLKDQQASLNTLGKAALNAAEGTKTRKDAIQRLMQEYPEYFKGLNAETTTNAQLKSILDSVNASYAKRIDVAREAYKIDQLSTQRIELFKKEAEFFDSIGNKQIEFQFGGSVAKFLETLKAGGKAAEDLRDKLDDAAMNGAAKFEIAARRINNEFVKVEKATTESNTRTKAANDAAQAAEVKAIEAHYNVLISQANGNKTKIAQLKQEEADAIDKINGVIKTNTVKSVTETAEKTKQVILVSDTEIALIKANGEADRQVDRIQQLKAQLDFINKQEDAEVDAAKRAVVNKKISASALAALQEQSRKDIAAIDAKYDLERAKVLEQIDQEEMKRFLTKIQESNDRVAVLTAKRLEAEKMLTQLNDAKTHEERLEALRIFNDKYNNAVKDAVVEQLRIQLEASAQELERVAEINGEKGDAYRAAYAAWLKDNEAYQKAITDQAVTATKETAESIKKYESDIREAHKETARIEKDTLEQRKQNRQQFISAFASLLGQEGGLLGQMASGLVSLYNGLDSLNVKGMESADKAVQSAKTALDGVQQVWSDGSAEGAARIARAQEDLSKAENKKAQTEGEYLQSVAGIAGTVYQVLSAIASAYNEHQAAVYKAIAEGMGRSRQIYKDFYDYVAQISESAHQAEMNTIRAGLAEKLSLLTAQYQQELALATDKNAKIAQYEQDQRNLVAQSLNEQIAAIRAHYAEQKRMAEGQERIDAALFFYQRMSEIQANAGGSAKALIEGVAQVEAEQMAKTQQARITQLQSTLQMFAEERDAKIAAINAGLDAFTAAKQKEIEAERAALDARKAATEQFYSDKALRLQNDEVFRAELLAQGEAREVTALEAAKQRELARAEESKASAEEVARIKASFDALIAETHAKYQDAMGSKEKEISLANEQVKAAEAEKKQSLEVETANKIQEIMETIAKQEAAAAQDRLEANAEFARQEMRIQNAIFSAQKAMKISELKAQIAILESQKGLFANNGAINAAIGAIQGAIGEITALSFDTGGVDIGYISSKFGKVGIGLARGSGGGVPGAGGGSGSTGGSGPVGGGSGPNAGNKPTGPVDGSGNPIGSAYDENGNEITLTYDPLGHSFSAFDSNKNAITVKFARGKANATGKEYFDGTDYLELGSNPRGRDTIPVMANEGERILPTADNLAIGGKGLSNSQLVDKVKFYDRFAAMYPNAFNPALLPASDMFARLRLPDSMMQAQPSLVQDMSKVVGELQQVRKSMDNLKQVNINLDKNGFSSALVEGQATVNYVMNQLTQ